MNRKEEKTGQKMQLNSLLHILRMDRLFAHDALQGLRLVDLCREAFDVVVMNPPFGDPTPLVLEYLETSYPRSKHDIASAFIERATMLCRPRGMIGWISPRTWFSSSFLEPFRREILYGSHRLSNVLDLGIGVLDSALVETAACTAEVANDYAAGVKVIRLLSSRSKETESLAKIKNQDVLGVTFSEISSLPRAAFGYWFPSEFRHTLAATPALNPGQGSAKQGLATTDDFRFLRLKWEVRPRDIGFDRRWVPFGKGGEYEPYYDDLHLVIEWESDGRLLKEYLVDQKGQAHWSRRIASAEFYGLPGLTYPERTTSDLSLRPLPKDSIFSATGQAVFFEDTPTALAYLGLSYTRIFKQLVELFVGGGDASESGSAARHYTSGILNDMPVPKLVWSEKIDVPGIVTTLIELRRLELRGDEVSNDFILPAICRPSSNISDAIQHEKREYFKNCIRALELAERLEVWASGIYGLSSRFGSEFLDAEICPYPIEYSRHQENTDISLNSVDLGKLIADVCERRGYKRAFTKKAYWANRILELASHYFERHPSECFVDGSGLSRHLQSPVPDLLSYCIGVAFGRWDIRFATGSIEIPDIPGPFDPIEMSQPGRLIRDNRAENSRSLHREGGRLDGYPMDIAESGILVDESGHPSDILASVEATLRCIWGDLADVVEQEMSSALGVRTLREYVRSTSGFFEHHLSRYSKSRRKAPIYWPLSTASGSYTLWIYYDSITDQTLYTAVNDFLEPKLGQVSNEVGVLRNKGSMRSTEEERQFETLLSVELELIEVRDTLLKLAPTYKPNHDDGVQICAAPLWPLFRHKPWQKVLKDTWTKLEKGECDWAHLSMNYWPERVREKCKVDKSLAIAHDLEELYIGPGIEGKKARNTKKV